MWFVMFQSVSWHGFQHALLVIHTVAHLVSECQLAWFLMCTLLVTLTVACIFSEGELSCV